MKLHVTDSRLVFEMKHLFDHAARNLHIISRRLEYKTRIGLRLLAQII